MRQLDEERAKPEGERDDKRVIALQDKDVDMRYAFYWERTRGGLSSSRAVAADLALVAPAPPVAVSPAPP